MRRKLAAFLMAFLMLATGCFMTNVEVRAEDVAGEDVDISEIMTEESLVSYAELVMRGIYLMEGYSVINDAGNNKIGAGGSTTAAIPCKVSVNAIVEKKVDGSWVRYTSWTVTNTSALTATASKTLSVTSGYWYRVRCVHSASTDTSSSYTGALYM